MQRKLEYFLRKEKDVVEKKSENETSIIIPDGVGVERSRKQKIKGTDHRIILYE